MGGGAGWLTFLYLVHTPAYFKLTRLLDHSC